MEKLFEYRFVIVLAVAVLIFALFEWEKVKGIIGSLMLNAKSLAKDAVLQSGKTQEDWVLMKAYQYLPKWITIFIPQEVMRKLIQYLYHMAKDYLDDRVINNSV
jgi:hypothetical protein